MARGVNKAIIIGHLGNKPDTRHTPNGATIANCSIATTEIWKDKNSGEQQEKTEWHRVVFFGRLAEIVEQYLGKGSHVYVEGRLQTKKWQDKEGNDRWTTEIVANEMQMLGGGRGQSEGNQDTGYDHANENQDTKQQSKGSDEPAEDFDDDIPF